MPESAPPISGPLRAWLSELSVDLAARRRDHQWRRLPAVLTRQGPEINVDGKTCVQFCTNNYLGLAAHPEVVDAVRRALTAWGFGAGASRLVGGSAAPHQELERALAAFKGVEAALLFSSGYVANLAALTTLAGPADRIISDKLNHASLLDAARFSGAEHRIFGHLNYKRAAFLLARPARLRAAASSAARRVTAPPGDSPAAPSLGSPAGAAAVAAPAPEGGDIGGVAGRDFLVTDTVFSMDGDLANLRELCALGRRYHALVMIDEAHATGVLGPDGRGVAALQEVEGEIALSVGTLSKALGAVGGFICGSQVVIDALINRARGFIYTTAAPAVSSAAALAALQVARREPQRRQRVLSLAQQVRDQLAALGYRGAVSPSPIVPLILGSSEAALQAAQWLREHGLYVPAIRPPTVAPQSARLRISLSAAHSDEHIARLLAALRQLRDALPHLTTDRRNLLYC